MAPIDAETGTEPVTGAEPCAAVLSVVAKKDEKKAVVPPVPPPVPVTTDITASLSAAVVSLVQPVGAEA